MSPAEPFYLDRPLVIAHRGARDVAPENTLAAFRAALDAGADGIELDVTRCGTGEIVVIHDDTVDRTTDGSGAVNTIPFYALRRLDAGRWFSADYTGIKIPTLDEVLDLAGDRLRLNIEIKGRSVHGDGIEEEIAQMVRAHGLQERVIISSFNPMALVRIRRCAPELARGLLYAQGLPIYLAHTWSLPLVQPEALHPESRLVDEALMQRARRRGCRVNVWTVNAPQEMQRMVDLGVDAIITDHPARLRSLLGG